MIKKTKIIKKNKKLTPIDHNFGGCVPYVKKDCVHSDKRFKHSGIRWLDSGICHNCPEKPCVYFKQWKNLLKEKDYYGIASFI